MVNANVVNFLKQKSRQRKLPKAEFYGDLETFFPSQSKDNREQGSRTKIILDHRIFRMVP